MAVIKSPNPPTLLTLLLYAYITGKIKASNEWTAVASFFGLPHYFNGRRAKAGLIKGLAQEVLYHMDVQDYIEVARLSWVLKDISEFITDQQQENLRQYLLNKPSYIEERD